MSHTAGTPLIAPQLELDGYRLRPLRPADASDWYAYLADPRVVEHTSFDIRGRGDVEALVAELRREYDEGRSCRWAIARYEDDVLVGTIGLHDPQQGTMEVGYDLARAAWGRGIATQALQQVLGWGFDVLALSRLQATVMEAHHASVRVLEKCGFEKEGVLRDYRRCRGELKDFGMFARLRRDLPL